MCTSASGPHMARPCEFLSGVRYRRELGFPIVNTELLTEVALTEAVAGLGQYSEHVVHAVPSRIKTWSGQQTDKVQNTEKETITIPPTCRESFIMYRKGGRPACSNSPGVPWTRA